VSWLDNITAWTQSAFEKTSGNKENRKQWRRTGDNAGTNTYRPVPFDINEYIQYGRLSRPLPFNRGRTISIR